MVRRLAAAVLGLLLLAAGGSPLMAGTTGKIAGKVTAKDGGEPVVGVSVLVEGTTMGGATGLDGSYVIVNVPPGTYAVVASGVGFQRRRFTNVKVSIDFTTRLDLEMSTDVIALETVEVQAEAPMIRKDLTSSQSTVDADAIQALPVESVTQVLTLQAGIVQGAGGDLHIRGGRSNEIAYTINGVSVSNPYDASRAVQIATNAIEELSVVSGTFNAEYGNALSGIVNTVTKEGGPTLRGSATFYTGDYLSSQDEIFPGANQYDILNHIVAEATLSGPLVDADRLSFFLSGRYDDSKGWLNGVRQHNPTDYVSKNIDDPTVIDTLVRTGDGAVVPMNPFRDASATAKISWSPVTALKLRYDVLYSNTWYQSYIHDLKYNPDANYNNYEWGLLNALDLRHSLGATTFYTVKLSATVNDYKRYLYPLEDAGGNAVSYNPTMTLDTSVYRASSRYQPDYKLLRAANYTFLSGGTPSGHSYQRTDTYAGKIDLTSQVTANHEVKAGLEVRYNEIFVESFTVLRDTIRYFSPTIADLSSPTHDKYSRYPWIGAAYLQDKMEFESIVLNVGLRYDYFNVQSAYGTDTFDPADPALREDAAPKHELSPRIGISFPITDRGIIHFSFGRFIQMPPFSYLYTNANFKTSLASASPTFGNANLNPEKTVTYEIGLQQQLLDNLAFNLTGFYKDVRDLLALQQIRVSGSETYYKYVNKDYANIKGIVFSLTKRRNAGDLWGLTLDYTFQVAEGNETNVNAFFIDLSSGRQSEKVPVALDWDQSHTLNMTVNVGRSGDWNLSLVGRLGTGLPYTPQITQGTVYLRANSDRKPSQATVDLLADKTFRLGLVDLTLFLKVYNLFDTLNERYVYNDTGRATYTLQSDYPTAKSTNELASEVPGIHPASEYFVVPTYYAPPRELRIGASVEF